MDLLPLLQVDDSLNDDTPLYRTVDFFSATSMITDKVFMYTRADQFADPNEGVDRLLKQLEVAIPGGGCGGMGWSDDVTAKQSHDAVKRSHFVSCWSKNPESVAMWSLYSPDLCSVRLQTTVGQLKQAALELLNKYSVLNISANDSDPLPPVSTSALIAPVHYDDLECIRAKLTRRFLAHKRIQARYKRKGINLPSLKEVDKRYYKREKARETASLNSTCRLKDLSFEHEQEVRIIVRLGQTRQRDLLLGEQKLSKPSSEHHCLFGRILKLLENVYDDLPKREFVTTNSMLVNSVAIDPRCPTHKSAFMTKWFQEKGINIVKSKCFGYLTDNFTVFPDQ